MRVSSVLIFFGIIIAIVPGAVLQAQEPAAARNVIVEPRAGSEGKKSLAILVGVQDYANLPTLKYCRRDVELLDKTLRETCKFDRVVTMTEDAAEHGRRPTLGNLSTQLRRWLTLANNGEYERVLLYFSGHGFRDKKDRLYFAPPDCDRQNLELTGLPQSFVKQMLDGCGRVRVKLLVLDCCHAGEGRGEGVGANGAELAPEFRLAKGLLTLASCRDDEVSLEWAAKKQGLFTYWLCEGLRGAADRDKDGVVDSDELHRYVLNHVQETSAAELHRDQTVVLRPSDDWRGIAALSRVPPGPHQPSSPHPSAREKEIINSLGMKLILVRPEDQRGLKLTSGFYMGVCEVTQGQYKNVMGKNPSWFSPEGPGKARLAEGATADFPVEQVSYAEADEFCRKLAQQEGLPEGGYRLPTEAEWEAAARAGSEADFGPAGDGTNLDQYAWFYENSDRHSHKVATRQPNAWGFHDMSGNVTEWCSDWFDEKEKAAKPSASPAESGHPERRDRRVLRGGSWNDSRDYCRLSDRNGVPPESRENCYGFRVVRVLGLNDLKMRRNEP